MNGLRAMATLIKEEIHPRNRLHIDTCIPITFDDKKCHFCEATYSKENTSPKYITSGMYGFKGDSADYIPGSIIPSRI